MKFFLFVPMFILLFSSCSKKTPQEEATGETATTSDLKNSREQDGIKSHSKK